MNSILKSGPGYDHLIVLHESTHDHSKDNCV